MSRSFKRNWLFLLKKRLSISLFIVYLLTVFMGKTPLELYILALFYTTELLEEEIRVMLFILIILKIEHLK